MGGKDMQALHPVRHATGADALNLRDLAEGATIGEIGLMRGPVGGCKILIITEPGLHVAHEPTRLKRANGTVDPRAREVEGRWERGSIGEPGESPDDIGGAACAPVGNRHHRPRGTAELSLHARDVGR